MNDYERLLAAARRGEGSARDDLFSTLIPRVQQMVDQSLGGPRGRAERRLPPMLSAGDVVQDVFLGVLRDLDGMRARTETAMMRYLSTVSRNRVVDAIRFHDACRRDRRRGHGGRSVEECADDATSPELAAITEEEVAAFREAIQALPERDRELLYERIGNRVPYRTLAGRFGLASDDSTRKAVCRAKDALRSRLQAVGVE